MRCNRYLLQDPALSLCGSVACIPAPSPFLASPTAGVRTKPPPREALAGGRAQQALAAPSLPQRARRAWPITYLRGHRAGQLAARAGGPG